MLTNNPGEIALRLFDDFVDTYKRDPQSLLEEEPNMISEDPEERRQ